MNNDYILTSEETKKFNATLNSILYIAITTQSSFA